MHTYSYFVSDGIRRSMPNLNKIRGRGGGFGFKRGSRLSNAFAQSETRSAVPSNVATYGLSQIHNSESTLGNTIDTTRMPPPNAIPGLRNQGGPGNQTGHISSRRSASTITGDSDVRQQHNSAIRYSSSNRGRGNANRFGGGGLRPPTAVNNPGRKISLPVTGESTSHPQYLTCRIKVHSNFTQFTYL